MAARVLTAALDFRPKKSSAFANGVLAGDPDAETMAAVYGGLDPVEPVGQCPGRLMPAAVRGSQQSAHLHVCRLARGAAAAAVQPHSQRPTGCELPVGAAEGARQPDALAPRRRRASAAATAQGVQPAHQHTAAVRAGAVCVADDVCGGCRSGHGARRHRARAVRRGAHRAEGKGARAFMLGGGRVGGNHKPGAG
eukprot:352986-Chlamydomonas_euryale.AAC.11